jgi:hypothetical protein
MKKASFTSTFVAALSAAVIATSTGTAASASDVQVAGDAVVTSGSVKATNGKYTTFTLGSNPGVTSTVGSVTGAITVTGTVARLRVSARGIVATTTGTVTSTIAKKSLEKFKLADKDLLALILGTSNVKGFQLVIAGENGALTGGKNLNNDGRYYVGALRTGGGEQILINENFDSLQGVGGYAGVQLIESRDSKGNVQGYGYAQVYALIPNPGVPGVTTWQLFIGNDTKFKQTVQQNATGQVTDCTKATFSPINLRGGGEAYMPSPTL